MHTIRLIVKNLRRNPIRSGLTALGIMILVPVVTLIWSILSFLDAATEEKASNLKAIVSERWTLPSQMPYSYATSLSEGASREPDDLRPEDSMTWSFFGGSLDPKTRTFDNSLFAFALQPQKLLTMMDELDSLPADQKERFGKVVDKLASNRQGLILGEDRLAAIDRRVGDRITLYGLNYKDINLEFEIVGTFPVGRYDNSAAMNVEYLLAALDAYPTSHSGKKHPLADKCLNLVWLRVPDRSAYETIGRQIAESPLYTSPSVKVETASSGVSTFLQAYRDLIWGMRWLLAPAILVTLAMVISNAIRISVRERRTEMAVMKVLGYRPNQILLLVLGEALLLGAVSGAISSIATYVLVNNAMGGVKFPIAFFGVFFIPNDALWWGLAIGLATSFLGSIVPAWSTRSVRVVDVFSKVG
ncbi:MAG: ABC transporter permease [Planctomycetales bacterium]|nr:ABC transporter permease [Planctomycetales bacterium]